MKISHCMSLIPAALMSTAALHLNAQTYLWYGHADVGVNFENDAWDLHVHHEDLGEFDPADVIIGVDVLAASNTVPTGAQWSFLGSSGDPVWILPQIEDVDLLFLGLGTEELASGLFVGDQITLTLNAVNGPGNFAMFETGIFGTPTVLMNSGDGIGPSDAIVLNAGSHRHVNWAFTAPGFYGIEFEASGTLVSGNTFTASGPVTYWFEITAVPEPGSLMLLGLGALGSRWFQRRPRP